MANLQDFGEKIGGARKDVWKARGLILTDLDEMNAAERKTHIKKDNVWPKSDWEQEIKDGKDQGLAYWQNEMRVSIPPRPPRDTQEAQDNYVEIVGHLRDMVMSLKEPAEIDSFYKKHLLNTYVTKPDYGYWVQVAPAAEGIINNKVLKTAQKSSREMKREAEKKLFGVPKDNQVYTQLKNNLAVFLYDGEHVNITADKYQPERNVLTIASSNGRSFHYFDKESPFYDPDKWEKGTYFIISNITRKPVEINFISRDDAEEFIENYALKAQEAVNSPDPTKSKDENNRKKGFTPPQLSHIKRTGRAYRRFNADGNLFMTDLGFRAGEYGNWVNENERQHFINMAYDGLRDLSRVLETKPSDISLSGSLAIALGSRGRGGAGAAAAHYEPDRQVINLTKMSGAGCLAHEWAHALDHAIGITYGKGGLASERPMPNMPESFKELLSLLKYKKATVSAEVVVEGHEERLRKAEKQLKNWIAYVKPRNISDDFDKKWNELSERITENAASFTGIEYMRLRRGDKILTHPDVEMLSQLRKTVTNHHIPLDAKQAISHWAKDINYHIQEIKNAQPEERKVKTDFYRASIEFDEVYSKAGHGYWQSDCEMFARAFDCYISDKLKAGGFRSDFLSGHADCFLMPDKDGKIVYAFPRGEERELLNEHFDKLFTELKERNFLHNYQEVIDITDSMNSMPEKRLSAAELDAKVGVQYEQMSLDDLIFSANEKSKAACASKKSSKDFSR